MREARIAGRAPGGPGRERRAHRQLPNQTDLIDTIAPDPPRPLDRRRA
ncbi:hypothetical protein K1T35_04535 [Pseudonocardia sp. DSM 110487]|nr:hypothetical protein [Pseudonocardia sp. DSM 110487]QYN36587.1 hypothetical protein K1T35_04535 [Pseudonocardia sp. DSM 110487]